MKENNRISKIELYHLKLPLVAHFETSFGRVDHQETLIIKISCGNFYGWGECPASGQPYYSSETVQTAQYIIKEFLSPLIIGKSFSNIQHLTSNFRVIRGHNMAKAGVIMALCDLSARLRNIPLAKLYGGKRKYIPSGISLGIQDNIGELLERIRRALQTGYQRIKIKIKPGWDLKVISTIRRRFPEIPLAADANGAYKLADRRLFQQMDKYRLMFVEQPLDYNDLVDHAELQKKIKTPICLDESIKSYHDVEQALKIKSCRIINIKPARVGGPLEAIRIHNLCLKSHIPVWCGGLLESGIGRLHNIALASLPGFTLPPDISESARYYKEDIINLPVTLQPDGTIKVPTGVGLGAAVNLRQLRQYAIKKIIETFQRK